MRVVERRVVINNRVGDQVRRPAYKAWFANPNQMNRVMLKSSRVHVLLTLSITVRVVMRDGAQ
jgi:hypothetical protein